MKAYVTEFLSAYPYDDEAKAAMLGALSKIEHTDGGSAEISAILALYKASKDCSFSSLLERFRSLAAGAEVKAHVADLLLCILLSGVLRLHYMAQGLSDTLFWDTMWDLYYKAVECKLICGYYGCFVTAWFDRYYNLSRFALGRFQFELDTCKYAYQKDGLSLSVGAPIIGVHIPRSGVSLSREVLDESYALAYAFFKKEFGEAPVAFICNSWLLFERHRDMLPPTSGICRFMGDYDIVRSGFFDDYGEVWRLFDKFYEGDLKRLPADTTLRRAYLSLMERGEKTGWGEGVFFYESYLRSSAGR